MKWLLIIPIGLAVIYSYLFFALYHHFKDYNPEWLNASHPVWGRTIME